MSSPTSSTHLAILRIALSAAILLVLLRQGMVAIPEYLQQAVHFSYPGLGWLPEPGAFGLYAVLAAAVAGTVGMALGLLYRVSAVVALLASGFLFFLDAAQYSSAAWLALLVTALLAALPANRALSLDVRTGRTRPGPAPAWATGAVRFLFATVLLYTGIWRLGDDWLQAQPVASWLMGWADLPLVGRSMFKPVTWQAVAWAWPVVHLIAVPLLFMQRTRMVAAITVALFYALAAVLLATPLYSLLIVCGLLAFVDFSRFLPATDEQNGTSQSSGMHPALSAVAIAVLSINVVLPARSILYPGSPAWTEEGQRFSWRQATRIKVCRQTYAVTSAQGGSTMTWKIKPESYLTPRQVRAANGNPDLIRQLALHLAETWQELHGVQEPGVYSQTWCSLNSRRYAPLVAEDADLTRVEYGLGPSDWILPLPPDLEPLGPFPTRPSGDEE